MNMRAVLFGLLMVALFVPSCFRAGDSDDDSSADASTDASGDSVTIQPADTSEPEDASWNLNDSTSGSGGGCADLAAAICKKAHGCADSNGEFVVALADRATITYSSLTQCNAAQPINEDNCMSAGDSARTACRDALESTTCNGNELKLTEACIFDGQ